MAKSTKNALPRRIAGMKIPKRLRKSPTLKAIARNPMMAELATAALIAGASAFAARDTKAGKSAKSKAREITERFVAEALAILEKFNSSRGDRHPPGAASPRPN